MAAPRLDTLLTPEPPDEVAGPSGRIYGGKSLGCLKPASPLRRTFIFVVESKVFEPVILLTILANCVTLAVQSPLDPPGTTKAAVIDVCEWLFLAIFTFELAAKVIAYGFVGSEGAYLRDSWCQLDFVIVTLAWLPLLLPSAGNFSAMRTLRALRPLRTLKHVPGMPVLVESIFRAVPRLVTVAGLCGAVLLVFSIVGVEMFKGQLHHYCTPVASANDDRAAAARSSAHNFRLRVSDLCDPSAPVDEQCGADERCVYFAATANSGTMTFDNAGGALVALMQAVTFDEFDVVMHKLAELFSPGASYAYFVSVIVICGFFIINLFLTVMFDEFMKAKAEDQLVESAIGSAIAQASPRQHGGGSSTEARVRGDETRALLPSGTQSSSASSSARDAGSGKGGTPADAQAASPLPPSTPLGRLVTAGWFGHIATSLVLLNLAIMCMPYQGMSDAYAARLEGAATLISLLFMVEMSLKLCGLGCAGYWRDGWNVLDGSIVLLSTVDLLVTLLAASSDVNLSFLRMLRMLRVLRVLRLMKSWKGLYKIVTTFAKALPQLGNMFVLMALTMLIFSLMGMQLFGGRYDATVGYSHDDCSGGLEACGSASSRLAPLPRQHYDYFVPAMITSFVLLTGEWAEAMVPAARVAGPLAIGFFILVVIIGMYLIMNLFVAILLNTFAADFVQQDGDHADRPRRRPASKAALANLADEIEREEWLDTHWLVPRGSWARRFCEACVASVRFDTFIIVAILISSAALAFDSPRLDPASSLAHVLTISNYIFFAIFFFECSVKTLSLGLVYGPDAYLRNAWNVLDFLIVATSFAAILAELVPALSGLASLRVLRVLRPLRLVSRNPGMKLIIRSLIKALPDVSNVFGVVLTFQIVFAILGLQLFMGSLASCTDPTLTTRAECVPPPQADAMPAAGTEQGGGASTRVAWENPQDVPGSFDDFGSVMLLLYVMSTADGWDTVMYRTMDATVAGQAPVRNDFSGAAIFSIVWMFVGCFFSMNLFVGVIVDNFNRIKKELEEADAGGTATMTSDQQKWAKAMISYLENADLKKRVAATHAPDHPIRRAVYDLVVSPFFEKAIFVVISANIALMASDYWRIEDDVTVYGYYTSAGTLFVHIYYLEASLKIVGMGKHYFGDAWCQLDFFLVLTAAVDEFAQELLAAAGADSSSTQSLRILRVLRILRIVRLLKGAKQLKKIMLTVLLCVPALLNVSALLLLTIFIFGVLGVHLFTFVRFTDTLSGEPADSNFESLGSAVMLLFQCLTGDGWAMLMLEASVSPESGHCSLEAGDCGSGVAIPFFVSFQIIGSFIFLNLVVAVMIESFTELGKAPDHTDEIVAMWQQVTLTTRIDAYVRALGTAGHAPVSDEAARALLRDRFDWNVYDALADRGLMHAASKVPELRAHPDDFSSDIYSIRPSVLRDIVLGLPPPIGLRGLAASYGDANKMCFRLALPSVKGRVIFRDVLKAFAHSAHASNPPAEAAPPLPLPSPDRSPGAAWSPTEASPDGTPAAYATTLADSQTLPPPKGHKQGVVQLDAAEQIALDAIGSVLREKQAAGQRLAAQRQRRNVLIRRQPQSTGVAEHAWESVSSGIFFPVGPLKQRWDALVMALVLYSVIMVPYRVCFDASATGNAWTFEVLVTVAFMADLLANFNTAFLEGERWTVDRGAIGVRYLQGWFWVDFPASIPVELLVAFLPSDGSADASTLKALRGLRLVRLLRLLKLLRLGALVASIETRLNVNLRVLKLGKMLGAICFVAHIQGCFWFYIASDEVAAQYATTWLEAYEDGTGRDAPPPVQYLYSVYWALMTLTTVGYGDITPTNDVERLYAAFSLLLGALVFGYLVGAVGSLVGSLDHRSNMVEEKLSCLQEVVLQHGLPPDLAARVRSYTEYYFSKQSVYDVEAVLAHLTPALSREVHEYFLGQSVNTIPLLRVHHAAFKQACFAALRPMFTEAGDALIPRGSRATDLFYLRRGEVHAMPHAVPHVPGDARIAVDMSDMGRLFGEHCLLQRASPLAYMAYTRCELLTMPAAALAHAACDDLPGANRERLAQGIVREFCRKACSLYVALRMKKIELEEVNGTGGTGAATAGKAGLGVRRTCAALAIQAAWFRRLAVPATHARVDVLSSAIRAAGSAPAVAASRNAAGSRAPSAHATAPGAAVTDGGGGGVGKLREELRQLDRAVREQEATARRDVADLRQQSKALDAKLDKVLESLSSVTKLCQENSHGKQFTA